MADFFDLLTKNTDIKISQKRFCKYCKEEFAIFDIEKKLYDKHWFKYQEVCAYCNFRLLNSLFNDKYLYIRKDSYTWEDLVSIFSKDYDWNIMEASEYRNKLSNDMALDYSRDLEEDIFWAFLKLYDDFPKPSRLIYPDLYNWEYASHSWWSKNVYLSYCVFLDNEDIYYSFRVLSSSKNVFLSYSVFQSSNIYQSSSVSDSNNIFFSSNILNSNNLYFCREMENSSDCIFCCNQINSKYKIFNKLYSKEEYISLKKNIFSKLKTISWYKQLKKDFIKFLDENLILKSTHTNKSEKVNWDMILYSNNSINNYFWNWTIDCVNSFSIWDDLNDKCENVHNSVECWTFVSNCLWSCSFWKNLNNIFFSFAVVENSKNLYYCVDIENCEECMFSVGLRNKRYYILNKSYSKEDYFKIKDLLIKKLQKDWKWWENLLHKIRFFPFNDTLWYDYFKVNKVIYPDWKEKIIDENANWIVKVFEDKFISKWELDLGWWEKLQILWRTKDKEINLPESAKITSLDEIEDIDEVWDEIMDRIIICEQTKRPFKIIKQELDFLKKKWLPVRTYHHDYILDKLIHTRPIGKTYISSCDKCNKETLSVFKQKPKYKVYCQSCYKESVYK